jgi:hypothetical protein
MWGRGHDMDIIFDDLVTVMQMGLCKVDIDVIFRLLASVEASNSIS